MEPFLVVRHLSKNFVRTDSVQEVLTEVSFDVEAGACLGIVGESGSGKTTLARIIAGFLPADSGTYTFSAPARVHMVFQNPLASFDPRQRIGAAVAEGLRNFGCAREAITFTTRLLLESCGLNGDYAQKYPHQLSGGECQRAALARALAITPNLLICDEATSALDVVVQKEIIELLHKLRQQLHLTMLFITHDLAVVQELCTEVLVMQSGRIVESGPVEQLLKKPALPYTQALVRASFLLK